MTDVKPCPCCGSDNLALEGPGYPHVHCLQCGCGMYAAPGLKDAILRWNRRALEISQEKTDLAGIDEASIFDELLSDDDEDSGDTRLMRLGLMPFPGEPKEEAEQRKQECLEDKRRENQIKARKAND